jgi:phosphopantothenoylcysteine decarboxylase/phosphopantothenate--cysteine ligase
MACGEFGPGRMAEPLEIVAAIEQALGAPGASDLKTLAGFKALVTAGPTHEPLDPVRFLANRSSGKQGYAIAGALAMAGADTVLVSGPVEIVAPSGVKLVKVTSGREMLAACEAELPVDIAVMSAAVADWRPDIALNSKIKKSGEPQTPTLKLVENPDILATLARHRQRPRLVVGFAAETDDVLAHAIAKRTRKNADWIVANDVSGNVMGGDRNQVHLITSAAREDWPEMSKPDVAHRLVARIARELQGSTV